MLLFVGTGVSTAALAGSWFSWSMQAPPAARTRRALLASEKWPRTMPLYCVERLTPRGEVRPTQTTQRAMYGIVCQYPFPWSAGASTVRRAISGDEELSPTGFGSSGLRSRGSGTWKSSSGSISTSLCSEKLILN